MKKDRLLTRKERAYVIKKITNNDDTNFDMIYKTLTKEKEDRLILQIIKKIMAPQDLPLLKENKKN